MQHVPNIGDMGLIGFSVIGNVQEYAPLLFAFANSGT